MNNLTALKCYKLINGILQLKLNEFSNRNTVNEQLIPELNNITNSMEYKILNNIPVNDGDLHINQYYTVFNKFKDLPNNFNSLVNYVDNELQTLAKFDNNLYINIVSRFFMGYPTVRDYLVDYPLSLDYLKTIYPMAADMFDFWRNKQIMDWIV